MMKTLAGFILTDYWVFPLSAGTKTISRIILVSVCAALLFSPSLCVLFFVALDLCSTFFSVICPLLFTPCALFFPTILPSFSLSFSPVFLPLFLFRLLPLLAPVFFFLFSSLFRALLSSSLPLLWFSGSPFQSNSSSVFFIFSFRVPGLFSLFTLPPLQSPVFLSCSPLFFFPLVPWISTSAVPPPLRSLIFSGFIARECQAPLQLKRLQSHYCRNRSCGRRRRRRRLISRNGAVCVMGMAICNPVTEVLKSCNQAPG